LHKVSKIENAISVDRKYSIKLIDLKNLKKIFENFTLATGFTIEG
jgi:hypothetical protein